VHRSFDSARLVATTVEELDFEPELHRETTVGCQQGRDWLGVHVSKAVDNKGKITAHQYMLGRKNHEKPQC